MPSAEHGERGSAMKVAAIQMSCIPGDVKANLMRAEMLLDEASRSQVRWAVLPELFGTGYHVEGNDRALAERLSSGVVSTWLRAQARERQMYLTAGIAEARPDGLCADAVATMSPEGELLGIYRKLHLWNGESERFVPGDRLPKPFVLGDGVRAASQICYEVGFPEGSRQAALAGANVLTYSAAFGAARVSVWDVAVRARAIENGCYVIAADLWGCEGEHPPFAGHSCVVAPSGEVISRVDEGEGLAMADINLAEVDDFRGKVPYLRDLRRDVVAYAWRDLDQG